MQVARRSLFDLVGLKAKLPLCIIFKTKIILKAGAFILTERRQEPYAQRAVRSVTPRRAGMEKNLLIIREIFWEHLLV